MSSKKVLLCSLVLAFSACGSEDLNEPQDEEHFAVIYGRVTDTEGVGVANAIIQGSSYATCASTSPVGSESTSTGSNGNYRIRIDYPDALRHCVVLQALPPLSAPTLLGDTIEIPDVQFARVPTDSIQRNIVFTLRPSGGGGGIP